ncbi:hypothetical protein BFJ63_vAg16092 [Fusarium oxysporum f. sp. narcissi]|uniref:Uncharacterized protein n=1 Tax=Fusarium oxysporum f. sp. narcissi TaxID=451672 RepID=A0A4V1RYB4_FUSOX|nr:hypothetical protein BFJ63_vAg16092 [Fusarium oxysporum f. sp. narcissi]
MNYKEMQSDGLCVRQGDEPDEEQEQGRGDEQPDPRIMVKHIEKQKADKAVQDVGSDEAGPGPGPGTVYKKAD